MRSRSPPRAGEQVGAERHHGRVVAIGGAVGLIAQQGDRLHIGVQTGCDHVQTLWWRDRRQPAPRAHVHGPRGSDPEPADVVVEQVELELVVARAGRCDHVDRHDRRPPRRHVGGQRRPQGGAFPDLVRAAPPAVAEPDCRTGVRPPAPRRRSQVRHPDIDRLLHAGDEGRRLSDELEAGAVEALGVRRPGPMVIHLVRADVQDLRIAGEHVGAEAERPAIAARSASGTGASASSGSSSGT